MALFHFLSWGPCPALPCMRKRSASCKLPHAHMADRLWTNISSVERRPWGLPLLGSSPDLLEAFSYAAGPASRCLVCH